MFKVLLLIALAIAGSHAQGVAPQGEAAPEPYSYGYETDSHAAAEQRDPSGRVTGYYTLADADGRQRRVEYVADEAGFRAKVQTNEVGTKSENSADVETLAAPPTREQLVVYPGQVQSQTVSAVQQPAQRVVSQVVSAAQPARSSQQVFVNQPYNGAYGYGSGSGYGSGYGYGAGYGANYAAYGANYGYYPGYAANGQYIYRSTTTGSPSYAAYGVAPAASGYGYNSGYYGVGNYNNHLPSSYYRSVTTTGAVPAAYGTSSGVVSGGYVAAPVASTGNYRTYQTVAAPTVSRSATSYSTVGASNLGGSSNYILLKKREAEQTAAATDDKSKNRN